MTKEMILSLHKRYLQGETGRALASEAGLHHSALLRYFKRAGLPGKPGGQGWHGDSAGHARVGKLGGDIISSDSSHMAKIGARGGKALVAKYGTRYMSAIARRK